MPDEIKFGVSNILETKEEEIKRLKKENDVLKRHLNVAYDELRRADIITEEECGVVQDPKLAEILNSKYLDGDFEKIGLNSVAIKHEGTIYLAEVKEKNEN